RTIAEVEVETKRMVEALRTKGLSASRAKKPLLHVKFGSLPIGFDIFPVFESEPGRLTLFMQQVEFGEIPVQVVLPLGTIEMAGRRLPAPADPYEMLRLRYGDGWRTPDRFFEATAR